MVITRLRLTNFRQHAQSELAFDRGLTAIVGPNGAGKSTLLEAIAWAMYGTVAARGNKDTIRRRGAPPRSPVEVELEFALGAHRYRVVRSLSGASLHLDGDAAPIANSTSAVTERIQRLLGMSRDEFFNTYFTGQKELAVMAAMGPGDRAQFLSRVLGYDRLSRAQQLLRADRTTLRARADGLRAGLADAALLAREVATATEQVAAATAAEAAALAQVGTAEGEIDRLTPAWEEQERLREQAMQLEAEAAGLAQRVQRAAAEAARAEQTVLTAEQAAARAAALAEQVAPLPALRAEEAVLQRDQDARARAAALDAELEQLAQRIAQADVEIAALPSPADLELALARCEAVTRERDAARTDADQRRETYVRDRQEAQTRREALLAQFQDLQQQLDRVKAAGGEGACPTCGRPLGASVDELVVTLAAQLDEVRVSGRYFKQRLDQLAKEPAELLEAEARARALDTDVAAAGAELARLELARRNEPKYSAAREKLVARRAALTEERGTLSGTFDEARLAAVRARIAELAPLELEAARQGALAGQLEGARAALARVTTERDEAAARQAAVTAERAALPYDAARHAERRSAMATAQDQLGRARVALAAAQGARTTAEAALGSATRRQREADERRAQLAEAEGELLLLNELDRAVTDLRTDLNATLRPDLAELTSGFVRDLTAGRYTDLELDEQYQLTLLDDGEPKRVISGGEEDVANLAFRLAISQMIAERAGQPLSLLVLDEIFGSLDEERRSAVLDLLRSLGDRFEQVILITHIDSVRDGVDRVIRVDYDRGQGTASVHDELPGAADVAA